MIFTLKCYGKKLNKRLSFTRFSIEKSTHYFGVWGENITILTP